jgi:hypothetical protein
LDLHSSETHISGIRPMTNFFPISDFSFPTFRFSDFFGPFSGSSVTCTRLSQHSLSDFPSFRLSDILFPTFRLYLSDFANSDFPTFRLLLSGFPTLPFRLSEFPTFRLLLSDFQTFRLSDIFIPAFRLANQANTTVKTDMKHATLGQYEAEMRSWREPC